MNFSDNFDTFDRDFWYVADFPIKAANWQWTAWEADYVTARDGEIELSFDTKDSMGKNYTGSEVQTNDWYKYGWYEVDMQASGESGVVSAFFAFTSTYFGAKRHNEIDFEFLGGDTTVVNINYYYGNQNLGAVDGSVQIDLGFDAAEGIHTYAFDWQPDSIGWYVDGKLVYEVTSDTAPVPIPDTKMKIMMDVWSGSFPRWHGEISDYLHKGGKTSAIYSRVAYYEDGRPGGATDSGTDTDSGGSGGGVSNEGGGGGGAATGSGVLPFFSRTGTNANETLKGGGGGDQIDGGRGNDIILGRGSADRLTGGAGNDNVNGGAGNDTLIYVIGRNFDVKDLYSGAAGTDVLQIFGTSEQLADSGLVADMAAWRSFVASNYDTSTNGGARFTFDSLGLTVRGIEKVELIDSDGGSGSVGAEGGETDGTDTTGDADDSGSGGGGGDDAGSGSGGGATSSSSLPSLARNGSDGNDRLLGGGAADSINGQGGNDYILGRGSADDLAGGAGSDLIKGGAGDDRLLYLIGDNAGANDRYEGSAGNDRLRIFGTEEELSDAGFLADIAELREFMDENRNLSTNGGPTFAFDSLGLSVRGVESVELVTLDDSPV